MMAGRATPEGTARYRARFTLPDAHWRQVLDWTVSSIGMGSYLGATTDAADQAYTEATRRALELGCNLIDTAINYRFQRSERAIGRGISVPRDQVIVCTKGGFNPSPGPMTWVEQAGVAKKSDVVAGCHCMTPKYLRHQIETSLKNLGLETIDVYYLHNPETQLGEIARAEFEERIAAAFETFEEAVAAGKIQVYGTATWNGYRVEREEQEHLSLERLQAIAVSVGGAAHHFRAVQLPYNLAMLEAFLAPTQNKVPLLQAAAGMMVVTSVPLLQTRLLKVMPPLEFPGLTTNAQRCIQFVRSTPGVVAPLVGMSQRAHVEENLATAKVAPLDPAEFERLVQR